jgi:DivIVA domain-containing protein
MDVTPQLIEQIDFAERRFGGYDPDQVDDFLERVGATIARLQDEARALNERAERAEHALAEAQRAASEATAAVAAAPAPVADDTDIEQATSTLLLAKRTAEAAISEARTEASRLLSDARSRSEAETRDAAAEADRLVREAQAQRDDLLRRAREDADAEFSEQRERFRAEIADLDATKVRCADDVRLLEGRVAEYRKDLVEVHAAISGLLDDPDSLRTRSPLEIDMTPASAAPASPFYATSSTPVVTIPDAQPEAVRAEDVSVVTEVPETASGDPWGPGSWSEVSAALSDDPVESPTMLFDDVFEPRQPADESVATPLTGDQGDKYLQELHEAVNIDDTEVDPAMDEFFEGDQEPRRKRGRRR